LPEGLGREAVVHAAEQGYAGGIWRIFAAVVAAGDTYVYAPETSREEALGLWLGGECFVACVGEEVLGTYILRPNQPGLGGHVANAAFMVDPAARGQGIGRLLGCHALGRAAELGFRAMQFNLVVATNTAAIGLWESLGFAVVGRLPGAFHWRRERYVDALVMYRSLAESKSWRPPVREGGPRPE
jgi:ribosomal protein S18 acetylase RimI-like enzyme